MERGPVEAAGTDEVDDQWGGHRGQPAPDQQRPEEHRKRLARRSAARPPSQAPSEMPARTTPMMPVNTSRLTPR